MNSRLIGSVCAVGISLCCHSDEDDDDDDDDDQWRRQLGGTGARAPPLRLCKFMDRPYTHKLLSIYISI